MLKLIILLSFLVSNDCRVEYLNKVLGSTSYNHYYLIVKVNNNGKEVDIAVLNYKLYGLLKSKESKFSNFDSYKNYMIERIDSNMPIFLTSKEINKIDAGIIYNDSSVLAISNNSNADFINKFFYVSEKQNYAVLNQDFDHKKIGAIMKSLFKRNYLMSMVEGRLTIEDLNFCPEHKKNN